MPNSSTVKTNPMRVLLLENSEADRQLIERELERAGIPSLMKRVDSEAAFIAALGEFAPDVVLTDHPLPEFDASAALSVLRKLRPTAPLIVVTEFLNGDKSVAFVRAGVEDLVLKRNIARLPASITNAVTVREPLEKLTPRQVEVLRLVAEGHRTREIADRLQLSIKTVESHRGEVMKRLGIHDVVSLVRYAVRVGLIAMAA